MTEQAWKLDHKQALICLTRVWSPRVNPAKPRRRATTYRLSHASQSLQHRRLDSGSPAEKMLHTIRTITPRLAIFHPTVPSWLLRPFTSTSPAPRKLDPQYPNEEIRRARYKQQAACHRARYRDDPVFRAAARQKQHDLYAKRKNDDTVQLYVQLRNWTRRHQWVREDLPWKYHLPLLYAHKMEHYCYGCDWTKIGGTQLWWRRKGDAALPDHHLLKDESESDEYLCHHCYVSKHARFEALPEGYEDVKTFRDLVARKNQFDQLAAASSDHSTP